MRPLISCIALHGAKWDRSMGFGFYLTLCRHAMIMWPRNCQLLTEQSSGGRSICPGVCVNNGGDRSSLGVFSVGLEYLVVGVVDAKIIIIKRETDWQWWSIWTTKKEILLTYCRRQRGAEHKLSVAHSTGVFGYTQYDHWEP